VIGSAAGNVYLRPVTDDDLILHARWLNDFNTERLTGALAVPRPVAQVVAGFRTGLATRRDVALFSVIEHATDAAIGWAFLVNIAPRHRSAELLIGIGEPSARGRGYGTSAVRLLVEHGFSDLGLRRVALNVYAFNHAGRRAYLNAGFREIGRRHASHVSGNRAWDTILMELTATDEGVAADARRGEDTTQLNAQTPESASEASPSPQPPAPSSQLPTDEPILNIVGEKVVLGPPTREQIPNYSRWFSDVETMRSQGSPEPAPRTVEEITKWYENEMSGNPNRAWFSVYERASLRNIGFVELNDIDFRHRTATMSLMVGEPDARGKGYGTEMARLILDYGFTALGLHNIALEVYEFNEAGQRAYRAAGFTEFARRTKAYYANGDWWDIIMMEALSTDFESPLLGQIFVPDAPR
jgi:RimJ/RimL family protein N-acetyltransferase